MGLSRLGSRSVGRRDLETSGVESIKRDDTGAIQFQSVATKQGATDTGLTGVTDSLSTTTQTSRAFASSATLAVSTSGSPSAGTVKLLRAGSTVTSVTGVTAATMLTTSGNTFTSTPATWTASLTSVAGGSLTIATWSQSREASRG